MSLHYLRTCSPRYFPGAGIAWGQVRWLACFASGCVDSANCVGQRRVIQSIAQFSALTLGIIQNVGTRYRTLWLIYEAKKVWRGGDTRLLDSQKHIHVFRRLTEHESGVHGARLRGGG